MSALAWYSRRYKFTPTDMIITKDPDGTYTISMREVRRVDAARRARLGRPRSTRVYVNCTAESLQAEARAGRARATTKGQS